jgi:hypothetical protein
MDEEKDKRKAPPDQNDLVTKCKNIDRIVEEAVKQGGTSA